MSDRARSRRLAALLLGSLALVLWAGIALATDWSTTLAFALGLPTAGTFVWWVLFAGWGGGPSDLQ